MGVQIVEADSDLYDAVRRLYLAHSSTLGFMPRGGFADRAQQGLLLGAVGDHGSLAGYVLYDLPRRHVAIRHLCVDDKKCGSGVARLLIEDIVLRHAEREGILLDCRNDYPAHGMWPKLDFEPVNEAAGRSQARYPLTTWWRGFGHPTLFSSHRDQTRPLVRIAIDTDVFHDLFEDRPNSIESRSLMTDWVREVAEVVITKEVVTEANRHSDGSIRALNRRRVDSFPRADVLTAKWEAAEASLRAAIGNPTLKDHDQRDLRQVARAGAAKVDYFVSQDGCLIRRYNKVALKLFGLRVATPGDCIQELWDESRPPYAPEQIERTRFQLETPAPDDRDKLLTTFLNSGQGEKKAAFARLIRSQRANPSACELKVVRDDDGRHVAIFGRSVSENVLDVPLLRVTGPAASTIARQVVHLQRSYAIDVGTPLIRINDPGLSPRVIAALLAESFVETDVGWWAVAIDRHAGPTDLADYLTEIGGAPDQLGLLTAATRLRQGVEPETVAELERRFAPMKIIGATLPTYLVPIRPHWAEQLFDNDLGSQTLLGRKDELGLSREHVYYSGSPQGSVVAPARILWYVAEGRVSGGRRLGTCAVRACSRLEEVVVDRPLTLHRRFKHLGIYTEFDVLGAAGSRHQAMALRFADTELFRRPVGLDELRELAKRYGHTLVLRSPRILVEHLFDAIYSRGTDDAP